MLDKGSPIAFVAMHIFNRLVSNRLDSSTCICLHERHRVMLSSYVAITQTGHVCTDWELIQAYKFCLSVWCLSVEDTATGKRFKTWYHHIFTIISALILKVPNQQPVGKAQYHCTRSPTTLTVAFVLGGPQTSPSQRRK